MTLSDDGSFKFDKDDIVINYNFWADGGQMSFVITNNMDVDVYVDLNRSFLVVNGMTFDYYQNRTYTTTSSSTVVNSSSFGASNTYAMANAVANAYASSYGNTASAIGTGSSYGSSRTTAYSSRTTSSNTVNKGVQYSEKEGVWIPAHASRHFSEFSLMEAPYRQCGFARNPGKKENAVLNFNQKNSPYVFDNELMFVIKGQEKRVVNSFYISGILNIQRDETYEDEFALDCDGNKTTEMIRIYKFSSPNRFFINYDFANNSSNNATDRMKKGDKSSTNTSATKKPWR